MKTVAIVCNTGLGDGILFERLAHELEKKGLRCCVYSDFLLKLAGLYPGVCIRAYPKDIDSPLSAFWSEHSEYVFQEYAPGSCTKHPKVILGENYRQKNQSWASLQADYLKSKGCEVDIPGSSLVAPKEWEYRLHANRVVIHPTSLKEDKNWPPSKFLQLALQLQNSRWQVLFCATQQEKAIWDPWLLERSLPPMMAQNLYECARAIYESGYFLGNDSGVAHLAPALGIPTLKIFDRPSRANFWSGGWPVAQEVLPWPMPGRFLRVRYWKQLLPVSRVKKSFDRLVERFPVV